MSSTSERGLLVLPLAMFLTIALVAAFLIIPSINREEIIEGQRLRHEQALAAAEGALSLALHRQADVPETKIGRATATAEWRPDAGRIQVTAAARVPGLRDAEVRAEVSRVYRVEEDGSLTRVE